MSARAIVIFVFTIFATNALCADNSFKQNPWQNVNNSSYNYNTQDKNFVTPWPALGGRRNQQNNLQSTRAPQWVRPNNGPNWVRNTSPTNSQGSNQNNNVPVQNFRPASQNSNSYNQERYYVREPNVNYPRFDSSANRANQNTYNRGGSYARPAGVNTVVSSGSFLTGSDDARGSNQGSSANSNVEVDDNELRQFSEDLLNKDTVNNAAQYVTINWQGLTTSRSTRDEAPLPLLSVSPAAYSLTTISKLLPLYDNYILEANKNEVTSQQEKNEEGDLLNAIVQTPVMQYTRNFLMSKGKIGRDVQEFKDLLNLIWFNMYSRQGGKLGSSAFEHVFLAEIKNNQVSGLHNWVYFNEEENKNHANYLGYMKKIDLGGKGYIVKFHFTLNGVDKPVNSMFIGTSPELEMALYSTCFLLRPDRVCPLKLNGNRFIIRTYTFRYRGKNLIGSAFPEI
uniref:Poly(U)-specific endoribonuclease homolog isoform X1 n=1 Tax=Diabrotica virgifera virgifera TaxID=50390 RepID=A0A6P7F710_DIAVI